MAESKTPEKTSSSAEESAAPYPKMDLCQRIHILTLYSKEQLSSSVELQTAVFEQIAVELQNPSLYRGLRETLYGSSGGIQACCRLTEAELEAMDAANAVTEKALLEKLALAAESAGDMELMDARVEIARFAAKCLSQQAALDANQALLDLPKVSSGKKIDALMESSRVASFYGNVTAADDYIDQADKLANAGGGSDWDRRNRLKVYKSLQRLLHRDMQTSSKLLLDCIATFSCNEICSYTEFIVYAILTNMLHLPRPDLKEKIIDGPEILSVVKDIPVVVSTFLSFMHSGAASSLRDGPLTTSPHIHPVSFSLPAR
jgi:26S proteasome regulatory subunit N7